jgi:Domain of unknown function (DUF4349)
LPSETEINFFSINGLQLAIPPDEAFRTMVVRNAFLFAPMRYFLFWLSLTAATLSACSDNKHPARRSVAVKSAEPVAEGGAMAAADERADEDAVGVVPSYSPSKSTSEGPITVAPAPSRLIIYHADLRVRVAEMPVASEQLEAAVKASGGWMSGLQETRESGEWKQETTIRVAPGRFNHLLKTLGGLGTVESKSLSTSDVTAEHADVTARLAAKRALEQEYLRLLKQGKKISDLLEVQEKIGEIREEIESTESRLKQLNDEVGFSTITVTLYQPLLLDAPNAPVISFGSRFAEAVFDGWRLVIGFVIGAVTVWPFWLIGGLLWWLVRRWRNRRKGLVK